MKKPPTPKPVPPKQPWYKQALAALGNAIGEAMSQRQ